MDYTGYDKSLYFAVATIVGIIVVTIVDIWVGKLGIIVLLAVAVTLLLVFLIRFLIKKTVQD
jgi:Flp pilus assembly protein TadB